MVQTKGLQEKDPLIGRGKLKEVSKDCEVINNQQQQNPNYLWTKWTQGGTKVTGDNREQVLWGKGCSPGMTQLLLEML